jgi:hypothetical protein
MMKILYQYRSVKLGAPPGCANYNRVHWPDDPYDSPEEFTNEANYGEVSLASIHRAAETVSSINHPVQKCDSPPTESSYSCTAGHDDPDRTYRQICDSFHLTNSPTRSEWLDDGNPVRLPDRDPLISEPEEFINPNTNGCWSHTTTSKNYSKDAVSINTMEVL